MVRLRCRYPRVRERRHGGFDLMQWIGEFVASSVGYLCPHIHVLRRKDGAGVTPYGHHQHLVRRQHQMLDEDVPLHAIGYDDTVH